MPPRRKTRAKVSGSEDDDDNTNTTAVRRSNRQTKTKSYAPPETSSESDDDRVVTKKVKTTKTRGTKRGIKSAHKGNSVPAKLKKDNGADGSGDKKKNTKKDAEVDESDDEEEEEENEEEPEMKTVIIKGKAPVDSFCVQKIGKAHVYYEGDDVWDAMLNQTDVDHNNNKYYIIQLLEEDGRKAYSVWLRWGRVGKKGQNKLSEYGADLEQAKREFSKKFHEKTKNVWDERGSFKKVPGKYDLLQMDYSTKPEENEDEVDSKIKKEVIKVPESKLDKKLQALVELICNVKAMEEAVIEMKYDAKKAPLGKLTTDQIKAGYIALKEIEAVINDGGGDTALTRACNNFYTRIPHDFGMKRPPLIKTSADVILKMQLLEALGDIEIAIKMLNEASKMVLENPVDSHYKLLNCSLTAIEKDSEMFMVIKEYLLNTHAKTHDLYTMELIDVFECCKGGEEDFLPIKDNRMLLWHGSRLTNWVGILKQGLRIAPPEAPVTGYMFGKGVYFADRSSKSANYCYANRTNNTGLMLLCEVALGTCNELINSDYNADKLPKGKHSVKGLGSVIPDFNRNYKMSDGTIIPYGKSITAKHKQPLVLNYNEYIVYDPKQVKMRYLVKVKFNFKI